MKILAVRADYGGCANYRIVEPARVAKQLGVDISIEDGLDVTAYQNKNTKLVEVKEIYTDADCIIIQRPLDNSFVSLIKQAKKQGIATIVELDDDFSSVHAFNAAYGAVTKMSHSNAKWIEAACKEADWVTVSTGALLKYGLHGRISILKNYVPESIFNFEPKYKLNQNKNISQFSIGWSGSVSTHPTDLQVTRGNINKILENNSNKIKFHSVGNIDKVRENLNIKNQNYISNTPWVPLEDYYQTLHENIDIGIVPLELSSFNNAKSYLKGLEMGALGIPFIASPTKEYQIFEINNIGKLAKTPNDWYKFLQKWIDMPVLYYKEAEQYRENIKNNFTYEQHAHEWVDTWLKAIEYRKKH